MGVGEMLHIGHDRSGRYTQFMSLLGEDSVLSTQGEPDVHPALEASHLINLLSIKKQTAHVLSRSDESTASLERLAPLSFERALARGVRLNLGFGGLMRKLIVILIYIDIILIY